MKRREASPRRCSLGRTCVSGHSRGRRRRGRGGCSKKSSWRCQERSATVPSRAAVSIDVHKAMEQRPRGVVAHEGHNEVPLHRVDVLWAFLGCRQECLRVGGRIHHRGATSRHHVTTLPRRNGLAPREWSRTASRFVHDELVFRADFTTGAGRSRPPESTPPPREDPRNGAKEHTGLMASPPGRGIVRGRMRQHNALPQTHDPQPGGRPAVAALV